MKAIAFAIICAAYLLVPQQAFDSLSDAHKTLHAWVMMTCIVGFWLCMLFEGNR